MRVAMNLIIVISALTLANVWAATVTSNSWSSLVYVVTCFMNAILIAAVIATCALRSSWLAFLVTTGVFLLLAVTKSEALTNVMQHVARIVESWKVLPPENSSTDYQPVERLAAALVISCPPIVGVAAGLLAILFFPGRRQAKPLDTHYRYP